MALTHSHPSFLLPLTPPPPPPPTPRSPYSLPLYFCFRGALDNAVTAYGALELLFEAEVNDDGFKWRVAGGVKQGLILCG